VPDWTRRLQTGSAFDRPFGVCPNRTVVLVDAARGGLLIGSYFGREAQESLRTVLVLAPNPGVREDLRPAEQRNGSAHVICGTVVFVRRLPPWTGNFRPREPPLHTHLRN
jgi:hypothetical protein